MAEPFNVEKFREQMRGQVPNAPQQVPAQMQASPASGMPPPMPHSYQAPRPPQQMPSQPQYAPQQMMPPVLQQRAAQPQPSAQNYNPPAGGQPQAWAPQSQAMPAPQMMQPQAGMAQMPQVPVFTPPPVGTAQEVMEEIKPKKSRFSLKRPRKEKLPKVKIEKPDGVSASKSSVRPFLLGLVSGVALSLIGSVFLGTIMTKKTDQKFESVAAATAEVEPVNEAPQAAIELTDVQSLPNR